LRGAGSLAEDLGIVDASREYYDHGLIAARAVGDRLQEATVVMSLGMLSANTGNYDEAIEFYAEALPIFEEIGNKRGIMSCLGNAASVSFYRGDLDAAEAGYKRAREILLEIDDPRSATVLLSNIGAVYNEQERFEEALEVNLQVVEEASALGDELGQANGQINVAEAYTNLGDLDRGALAAEQALAIAERIGLTRVTGFARGTLAHIERARGNLTAAAELAGLALVDLRSANDQAAMATIAATMADLVLAANQPVESARFYGLAEVLLKSVDADQIPRAAELMERNLADIRSRIGQDALTAAREDGTRRSPDEFAALIDGFVLTSSQKPVDPVEAAVMAETGMAPSDLALLRLFLAGKSHAEMASELTTTTAVVVNRIGYLYTRTGTNSRATLTAWAFKAGIA